VQASPDGIVREVYKMSDPDYRLGDCLQSIGELRAQLGLQHLAVVVLGRLSTKRYSRGRLVAGDVPDAQGIEIMPSTGDFSL